MRRWITSFPVSLLVGLLLGILLTLLLRQASAFLFGVVLGVVLEQLLLGVKGAVDQWRRTHPIRRLLGSISDDAAVWVYFSSLFRDLSKPDEYKLTRRPDVPGQEEVLVTGPSLVLAEGDAISLALIQSLLTGGKIPPGNVHVERAEKDLEQWGMSSFCIGAHNARTRVILEKYRDLVFSFDNNYTVITRPASPSSAGVQAGTEVRRGVFIEQSEDSGPTDYGIILKLKDQFHPSKKTIFVIAGIGPAGTSGAAYYLLTNSTELASRGEEFGVLVQVPSGFQSARIVEFDQVANYYIPMIESEPRRGQRQ